MGEGVGEDAARRAVLIAGPTASGKSALALQLAAETGGLIVNTDALQVYAGLRLITARPGDADLAAVPHALYGTVDPTIRYSTGAWLDAVREVLRQNPGRVLYFVGGTGLYFDALLNGLAAVPPVPVGIVAALERELAGLDATGREALLAAEDPDMAERLAAPDPQRVARALAVKRATGVSLAAFQDRGGAAPLDGFAVERLVVDPGRDVLRERIALRFAAMLDSGAAAEVEALLARRLDPSLPAMKAIGVPEIAAMLAGELSRAEAVERAIIATRQYAKRQRTWLRNRMGDWPRWSPVVA